MTTFVGIIHVIVALVLIVLVLLQDSKSDGALGIGGGAGSNSLLGATGAQTLAGKMTVWAAIIFAVTCLSLSLFTSSNKKSVVDTLPAAAPVQTAPAADATPIETHATAATPAPEATAPAAAPSASPEAPATK